MGKQQDKSSLLDFSKLSLDDFKKINQDKQCSSKDFQPLLKYSLWHFFESVVGALIKDCRESLNFLDASVGASHLLTIGEVLGNQTIQMLSKSIKVEGRVEGCKEKELKIKALKESRSKPLYELVSHKRKYSKFFKD